MGNTTWKSLAAPALLCILLASPPQVAHAAWPHDPVVGNLGISTVLDGQRSAVVVSDGVKGAIIAWVDEQFGGTDIVAQRVDSTGASIWFAPNPLTFGQVVDDAGSMIMIPDGAGGAIIAWQGATTSINIYAQRVGSNGAPLWSFPGGVPICTASGAQYLQAIVPDGSGGAVIVWVDQRAAQALYAQRINASGVVQWAVNGVSLGGTPILAKAAPDGAGGAICAWNDYRRLLAGPSFVDIYARRITGGGVPQWAANGILLGSNPAGASALDLALTGSPTVTYDGVSGAVVAWSSATSTNVGDILAQRINSSGNLLWTAGGVALCAAAGAQLTPVSVPDGSSGAIVAWEDDRAGVDIYARRITAAGALNWAANGVALCAAAGAQARPVMVADGSGGAIVVWEDNRNLSTDIFGQRIGGNGVVQWTADGAAISAALNIQERPAIDSDGSGGIIAAWQDYRNTVPFPGTDVDIYAQRVETFGKLGNPEPVSSGVRDVRNDQGGNVRVSWLPSYLDAAPDYAVTSYWIWRSTPANQAQAAIQAGARLIAPGESPLGARGRAFTTSIENGQVVFWEYLASQTASGDAGYSYVAPTASDSVAGSNPKTLFRIQARGVGGVAFWNSLPDSGYSVDNLSPAMAASFSAQYFPGSAPPGPARAAAAPYTWLHWSPSQEADFLEYRLYRGGSPNFVPAPGNLVIAKQDTGYVDVGAPPSFYKLVVLDTHGNTSTASAAVPANLTDVELSSEAHGFWLTSGVPNPMKSSCEMRFSVSAGGAVSLEVYDASGRLVRSLVSDRRPAGEYTVRWDGTDGSGHSVRAGLYFIRLKTQGRELTRKLITMR